MISMNRDPPDLVAQNVDYAVTLVRLLGGVPSTGGGLMVPGVDHHVHVFFADEHVYITPAATNEWLIHHPKTNRVDLRLPIDEFNAKFDALVALAAAQVGGEQ